MISAILEWHDLHHQERSQKILLTQGNLYNTENRPNETGNDNAIVLINFRDKYIIINESINSTLGESMKFPEGIAITKSAVGAPLTKRDLHALQRRKELLETAKDLFYEQGYHATTVRMIHRKLGLSDGLFYHYFPGGKLELLTAIIREGEEKLTSRVESVFHAALNGLPLEEVLVNYAVEYYEACVSDYKWLAICYHEWKIFKGNHQDILSDLYCRRETWLTDYLRECHQKGLIQPFDFEIAVKQIMALIFLPITGLFTGIRVIEGEYREFFAKSIHFIVRTWQLL